MILIPLASTILLLSSLALIQSIRTADDSDEASFWGVFLWLPLVLLSFIFLVCLLFAGLRYGDWL